MMTIAAIVSVSTISMGHRSLDSTIIQESEHFLLEVSFHDGIMANYHRRT